MRVTLRMTGKVRQRVERLELVAARWADAKIHVDTNKMECMNRLMAEVTEVVQDLQELPP